MKQIETPGGMPALRLRTGRSGLMSGFTYQGQHMGLPFSHDPTSLPVFSLGVS